MGKTLIGSILGMLPMEIFILLELNNRLYLCSKLFFFVILIFQKCEIYIVNIWFMKWQGILINGQFPGPQIDSVTNDNLIISVFNSLDQPFLISWLVYSLF
jgi:hypothetical protein